MIDIIILFTIVAWLILVIAIWRENIWLSYLSGIMILILGMNGLVYGVQDVNSNLTRMYSVVNIGIGLFLILISSLEAIDA